MMKYECINLNRQPVIIKTINLVGSYFCPVRIKSREFCIIPSGNGTIRVPARFLCYFIFANEKYSSLCGLHCIRNFELTIRSLSISAKNAQRIHRELSHEFPKSEKAIWRARQVQWNTPSLLWLSKEPHLVHILSTCSRRGIAASVIIQPIWFMCESCGRQLLQKLSHRIKKKSHPLP